MNFIHEQFFDFLKSSFPLEPQPFTLSIPKPRKFEEPEIKIPNTIKARVIPKGVYYGTGEKEALEKAKIQNRQKAQVCYLIFI